VHNKIEKPRPLETGTHELGTKDGGTLHDGKALERVVDQIASLVDDLKNIFPVEPVCHKLADIEIEEVKDEASLTMLEDAGSTRLCRMRPHRKSSPS
jgi:hypothetical protein